jgi:cob(I)alamin adenosyltransferase
MARLTRIYTRSGDAGQTGLADGSRLPKSSPRIQALGDLDELNAAIGLVRAFARGMDTDPLLEKIQQQLFELGGELARPGGSLLTERQATELERAIDRLNAALPPLREFILPGGPPAAAQCHCARALCRRAERSLWRLKEQEAVNSASLKYLNRLSDLLFVVARHLTHGQGAEETTWKQET